AARCRFDLVRGEERDDDVIAESARLGENLSVGVEDHRAPGLDRVPVASDGVREERVDAVLEGAAWKPPHEPAAAFRSFELEAKRHRVAIARLPKLRSNPTASGHDGVEPAGDV